jgi:cytochrome c-type biogenesis protein CcmH
MSAAFLALALAMLIAASGFVVWPLWRATSSTSVSVAPRRRSAVGLSVVLAAASIGGYAVVGQPQTWLQPELLVPLARTQPSNPEEAPSLSEAAGPGQVESEGGAPAAGMAEGIGPAQIEAMVQRLAQRLQSKPDDVEGWRMLARSYETLRRFDEAAQAYRRIIALSQPNADLLVDYAVALGMSQGQTLAGEPEAALNEALKLQPAHAQALALSGSAAFERHDHARAIARWQKLLEGIPADAEMRPAIQANIDKARTLSKAGR